MIIRGYTSTANDGGIGVVSGNGSVACFTGNPQNTKIVNMRLTNTGSNVVVTLGASSILVNCEIDTSTGGGVLASAANIFAIGCYFHNLAGNAAQTTGVLFCTFRNETNDVANAILFDTMALFNIIDIDGASHGIAFNSDNGIAMFNSIFSNGGTGTGLRNNSTTRTNLYIINNTVQGFSGSGGIGIQVAGQNVNLVGHNICYNNATNYSITGDVNINLGNNDTAGASPFTNAGSDDFDPIAGLLALYPSYPTGWNNYASTQQNLLRMAAQYAPSVAGGGGPIFGGMVIR